jgi:hypothetical protein
VIRAGGIVLALFLLLVLVDLLARDRSNAAPRFFRESPAVAVCRPTQKLGTTIDFLPTPADAVAQAAEQHKLVFLLHISGNFEESGFT